jgi:hypothetical protein
VNPEALEPPPTAPVPRTFTVCWVDGTISTFENVTKSARDREFMFIGTYEREWVLNLEHTTLITIVDE